LQSTNLHFEYQQPDEFRVDALLKELCSAIAISTVVDSEHFYTSRTDLAISSREKDVHIREFYHVAKQHDVLMEGDQPLTGKWNYDSENRKNYPKPQAYSAFSFLMT
jgi:deoxyribodipyrimidine photolyase-related protein